MTATIPTNWSFSRWDCWRQCPLKYKLQFIDKLPTRPSTAMVRGNAVHVALAKYVEGKTEAVPAEVKHREHQAVVAFMRDFDGMKLVEKQWGFDEKWKPTGYFGKDIWLRAILDVALIYDDAEVEAVDWKTGKIYGSNEDQVELFALTVMWQYTQAQNVVTRLVYLDDKDGTQLLSEFPAKDKAKLTTKWVEAARPMLADRAWLARPNDKCVWCDFGQSKGGPCRHG